MDIVQSLPPLVTLVLALLLVIWLVLFLLVPFMLESIRSWSRKSCQELEEMNKKLDRLAILLDDREHDDRDSSDNRARREPTISDVAPIPPDARRRTPPRG